MPSPFPGMNPYLEQPVVWQDFHNTFLIAVRETLTPLLLPNYFVRVEEHVFVHEYESGTDELRSAYLEIRDRGGRNVVTVIELLSPSNKYAGSDREVYWNKVRRVLASRSHFVELDLLRGGPRMPWVGLPDCAYYALISRQEVRPRADVWPVGLRDQLPVIPIPVKSGEPEPTVDIQAILHRVYDSAGYAASIYDGEPEPRLSPDDAAWAAQLLK